MLSIRDHSYNTASPTSSIPLFLSRCTNENILCFQGSFPFMKHSKSMPATTICLICDAQTLLMDKFIHYIWSLHIWWNCPWLIHELRHKHLITGVFQNSTMSSSCSVSSLMAIHRVIKGNVYILHFIEQVKFLNTYSQLCRDETSFMMVCLNFFQLYGVMKETIRIIFWT